MGWRTQVSGVIVAIALCIGLVACGTMPSPAPSPSPTSPSPEGSRVEPPVDVALSCWSVGDEECRAIFQAALARLPPGAPVVVAQVTAYGCVSGPCAPGVLARGQGQVLVEQAGGRALFTWDLTRAADGGLAFGPPTDASAGSFEPRSERAVAPVAPLSLGHCGLSSPIDFDTSFWDPIGQVDGDAAEAINSGSGTIRLLGPQDAEYRAGPGFVLRLRRHAGAKAFQGCA